MAAEVLLYRLGCLIHWGPREREIRTALRSLPPHLLEGARLVDVGSGLGQLSRVARDLGLEYFGLEPDPKLRGAASRDYANATFSHLGAQDLGAMVGAKDIVVLNGVAHHLDDGLFEKAIEAARLGRGLVVVDHRLDRDTHLVARRLQDWDLGKFVRPYERFKTLPGMRSQYSRFFTIGPLGLPFWTHFCDVHVPS